MPDRDKTPASDLVQARGFPLEPGAAGLPTAEPFETRPPADHAMRRAAPGRSAQEPSPSWCAIPAAWTRPDTANFRKMFET